MSPIRPQPDGWIVVFPGLRWAASYRREREMEQFSGAEWDLEYVEPEPMGHEWGDHATSDGSYDPFPFEALAGHAAAVPVASSPVAPTPDPASPTVDQVVEDFGGGSLDIDPADAFSDELVDAAEPTAANALQDPEAEVALLDMAEVDPFDAFDEEFALVVEEFEAELPAVAEMVEG